MKKTPVYGYEVVMNLHGCDVKIMSDKKMLQKYVIDLCKIIDMKRYGKTLLPYFGLSEAFTKGYSMVQLIETSAITGHFSELWKTAYINVFSCKTFDMKLTAKFTKEFFKAKSVKTHFLTR